MANREPIPLASSVLTASDREAVNAALDSGRLALGPWIKRFEASLSESVGTRHAIAVSSGTSALRVAAPPLPWTVQPGQTRVIELQYEKPAAPTALLAMLGYSFEIQGLQ